MPVPPRRLLVALLLPLVIVLCVSRVHAHANFERSSPAVNAELNAAPDEIRLWFTEPLEPAFSRITLRDSHGTLVEIPPVQVDIADRHQLFVPLDGLPDGLYSVSWCVTSSADGHTTQGSFSFGINAVMSSTDVEANPEPPIAVESVSVRAFNLLAVSLMIGGIGFILFVWQPTTTGDAALSAQWLFRFVRMGWGCLGAALVLGLALQTSLATDLSFWDTFTSAAWQVIITQTTFGRLWLIRVLLWLAIGIALWRGGVRPRTLHLTLALGMLFLLVQSAYSHASAAEDHAAAVAANWLHLMATTLWVGGLIAFLLVLLILRRDAQLSAAFTGTLVARFSNYARVAVAALVITGLYAAWLHVGSLPALLNTVYGQALLVKMLLFVPLLLVAGVNLIWTQRALHLGKSVWIGRLRGFIGAEIALLLGILLAVGVLSSGSPARPLQAAREAVAAVPAVEPYFGMEHLDEGSMIHLEVVPAVVGQNEFIITPFDEAGEPITDVSSIRMRFESLDQAVGISELRPESTAPGVYRASGANLSLPGEWRIRLTIQRPSRFDTIANFAIAVAPPPTTSPATFRLTIPVAERIVITAILGIVLLMVGGFFFARERAAQLTTGHVLSGVALFVGLVALLNVATMMTTGRVTLLNAWARPVSSGMTTAIYVSIINNTPATQQLVGAEVSVESEVELHQTQVADNIARMRSFESVSIPAFSAFEIAPGGYHSMLTDVQQDLSMGQTFILTLIFPNGSRITAPVTVQNQPSNE